ncbi:hypothetical protein [Psychrobacter vallis]|uniref:hypothetical protein n=1 Tax=Psychrobacter vallis TaxID=248451 RepID=UPI001D12DAA5|nr:hypothetical protein [Psychrobacter vallis]
MTNHSEDTSMAKRLINMIVIATTSLWALTGCDNGAETSNQTTEPAAATAAPSASTAATNTIDWSLVASGETPADRASYQYPFALDSQNVRDYADYFKVDNATAQHNLTISMASNEALSKALDQLSETYVSHEVIDSKDMKLVIHTTPDVAASSYDYVLSDDFAKGLVLPIEIKPDGKKGDVTAHGEMAE